MSTWNRADAMEFAQVMVDHIVPPYRALMESYDKAQSIQKSGRETKLDRLEGVPGSPHTDLKGSRPRSQPANR